MLISTRARTAPAGVSG